MACQIPVVCSRSGTRDFAFHNKTALVVPFPHSLLLRHQIKKLLKDEELRLRIARAGYEKIQKYSWSALADRLEKILKELVKLN
jgi:glycosyltransferase involved in cell wall biosynthesis